MTDSYLLSLFLMPSPVAGPHAGYLLMGRLEQCVWGRWLEVKLPVSPSCVFSFPLSAVPSWSPGFFPWRTALETKISSVYTKLKGNACWHSQSPPQHGLFWPLPYLTCNLPQQQDTCPHCPLSTNFTVQFQYTPTAFWNCQSLSLSEPNFIKHSTVFKHSSFCLNSYKCRSFSNLLTSDPTSYIYNIIKVTCHILHSMLVSPPYKWF